MLTSSARLEAADLIVVDDSWKRTWPEAHVGVLAVRGVENPAVCAPLETKKDELLRSLRLRLPDREAILSWHTIRVYADYFKRFKKTYHVLMQLESVACKGKELPAVSAVVESMFMAELDSGILTAGHDLDRLERPLRLGAAAGGETYEGMSGKLQDVKSQDMLMADGRGVIASVLGGPDGRTKITAQTQRCLFVAYAPPGIAAASLERHLAAIRDNLSLFCSELQVEQLTVYGD